MLIVCNGAAKSGSTWLYNIVRLLVTAEWPAEQYLTSSRKHPTIRPTLLEAYLETEDYGSRDVITKTHYGSSDQRDLLLKWPDVRVIDMERSLYDVIVSTYYDSRLRAGFQKNFSSYYWFEGRAQAAYLIRYHQVWAEPNPQVCVTSFEALKTNFASEVRKIASFIGVEVDNARIALIQSETTLDTMRDKYKGDAFYSDPINPFFRKGMIGDWKNHFDARMLHDVQRIERHGLGRFDVVELVNRLRRAVYLRWPGLSPYRRPAAADNNH